MTFGEKLVQLRRARGLSQEALAEAVGVSRQAVSKWELGTAAPEVDKILALAEFYGVTTDYLLRVEMAPAPMEQKTSAPRPILAMGIALAGCAAGLVLIAWNLYEWLQIAGVVLQIIAGIAGVAYFLQLCQSQVKDGKLWLKRYARFAIWLEAPYPVGWLVHGLFWIKQGMNFMDWIPVSLLAYFALCMGVTIWSFDRKK